MQNRTDCMDLKLKQRVKLNLWLEFENWNETWKTEIQKAKTKLIPSAGAKTRADTAQPQIGGT